MAKLVVSITFAKDNPDKATIGMVVANAGIASGQETIAFFSSEGVRLAKKDMPTTFTRKDSRR